MKKVLGIVGSPRRKGNTDILVSKILQGAKDEGARTDIIYLSELHIRECDGCHTCWKGKSCTKKDDMNEVYSKIIESDILVFGTPVYWYGPTALMKAMIDRFVYFNGPENRRKIKNKRAILAIPYEERAFKTAEPVLAFFKKVFKYVEIKLIGSVVVPGVSQRGAILKKRGYLKKGYELGRNSVSAATCHYESME